MAADTISARPAESNYSHSSPLCKAKTLAWASAPRYPSLLIAADTISARPAMTTGVRDVGDSLLCIARYLHSFLAQSVVPIMVALLVACLSELIRKVCLVAEAM